MESRDIEDNLEIQNDINPDNSRSMELNIVDNIGVGISNSTNVYNIGVGISNSCNNLLDGNDFNECFRNNKEDKNNETDFSLHNTLIYYLF
jgi:hypothetical protein